MRKQSRDPEVYAKRTKRDNTNEASDLVCDNPTEGRNMRAKPPSIAGREGLASCDAKFLESIRSLLSRICDGFFRAVISCHYQVTEWLYADGRRGDVKRRE